MGELPFLGSLLLILSAMVLQLALLFLESCKVRTLCTKYD